MTVMAQQHRGAVAAYAKSSVHTASAVQLLIMLLDRLCLDIERGARAMVAGTYDEANSQYTHAQAIVTELQGALDTDFKGGPELMSLYVYLNKQLVVANVRHDIGAAKESLKIARHVTETWKLCADAIGEKY